MESLNLKGLGLKQNSLIYRMIKEQLVIRTIHDYRDNSRDNQLQDLEGDNTYESVPERIVQSLYDRGILLVRTINKCIDIDIDEFIINKSVIEKFKP